jgi:Cu(I)/Ag(I) efflux system membrane protein CusA/SilA
MSLSGIAISIGVLVDAGIVMTENAYHRLHERFGSRPVTGDTSAIVLDACKVVGGPLFFSILIMLLSFAPIFVLGGVEGRMFHPLAYTKSFALAGVAILAITLVPALLPSFLRGRLRSQEEVWLVRSFVNIYKPMLEFFIKCPDVIVCITGLFLLWGLPVFPQKVPWIFFVVGVPFLVALSVLVVARRKAACFAILFFAALAAFKTMKPLGEEFMPPLDELAILDMPVTTPNANISQASADLKARDLVLRGFPEVHQVVGKAGRAETPTDPAPVDMVETVVSLRPRQWWPRRELRFEDFERLAGESTRKLIDAGVLEPLEPAAAGDFAASLMDALFRFDRVTRGLCMQRLRDYTPEKGRALIGALRRELIAFLDAKGALRAAPPDAAWTALEDELARARAAALDEWILAPDLEVLVKRLLAFLIEQKAVEDRPDLLAPAPGSFEKALDALRALAGAEAGDFVERARGALERQHDALMRERMRHLDWELQDRAAGMLAWCILEEALERGRALGKLARELDDAGKQELAAQLEKGFGGFFLWRKAPAALQKEMDAALQVPGWSNIFTRPIQNRVDMLATGVRTMIGVKVFGTDLETIQRLSRDIAAVLREVPGAVDVTPDQVTGENYVEIRIDRERAARYGVSVDAVHEAIETALGGKEASTIIDGRRRFPIRVRYPRDERDGVERVKEILVAAGAGAGAMGAAEGLDGAAAAAGASMPSSAAPRPDDSLTPAIRLRQVPLGLVAGVEVVSGPTMIKSENGLLRSYVQLNVRDRDIVGFVDEARRAVDSKVERPEGYYIEWSGQFEHQMRAQRTLTIVFPLVLLVIFAILYLAYRDLADTLMMFLAVPGAVAGGALFQSLWGYDFSVAVWVGYIACFGLATETGIVMLVYLREAIARRGGLEAFKSEDEIREAVIEGAVHRLRPKLLTEGTTILALIPMLWATGVGAEYMRPMAAPIVGGILVADEVIDIFIPVLFFWERRRRWRALGGSSS